MSIECALTKRKLLEYCDGLLRPDEKARLQEHLERCRKCSILLKRLEASGNAIESLKSVPLEISASFREKAIKSIIAETEKARPKPRLSPRLAASIGTAAVVILILAVVFAIKPWATRPTQPLEEGTVSSEFKEAAGTAGEPRKMPHETRDEATVTAPAPEASGELILPVALYKQANYNRDSIRTMLENLSVRKEVAQNMTMGHSILYSRTYAKKLADEFSKIGVDGALIEAMVSYAIRSQPVLLPFYGEKALYEGREAIIIVFAGPRRTGESTALSRFEVWVLEPSIFRVSPDSSLLLFHEQRF